MTTAPPEITPSRVDPAPFALRPELVAAYRRDGFVVGLPVLDAGRVDELRARVDWLVPRLGELGDRLYEVELAYTERPGEVVCHFLGGWLVDDLLRALITAPAVTVPAAQLLGVDRLRFWHDQAFCKPPRHPGVVPWHQDYSYWTRVGPPRHLTVNVVLDDAGRDNGCLQFVPGSHRWGLLPSVPFDAGLDAIAAHLDPAQRAALAAPVAAVQPAGHASIHDAFTLHGSGPNASGRPRRSLVLNYMAPDTRVVDGGSPLLRHTPPLAAGDLVAGPFFPIVLDAGGAGEDG